MKFLFHFAFIFTPFIAFSQISYESTDFINITESILTSTANPVQGSIDWSDTGEDTIWNFNDLSIVSQNSTDYIDPNNSGYKTSWCLLNGAIFNCDEVYNDFVNRATDFIGFNINGIPLENVISHYDLSAQTFEEKFLGAALDFGGMSIPITVNLDSPDTIYQFPFTYNQTEQSQRQLAIDLSPFGLAGGYSSNSVRTNHVEGWGQLITPFDTFEHTLKMRTIIEASDTFTFDTTSADVNYTQIEYKWFDKNYPIPVLSVQGIIVDSVELITQVNFIDQPRCLQPKANFTSLPFNPIADSINETAVINFTNLTTGFDSLIWDFGDGNISNEENPDYTYTCGGDYEVSLFAFNTVCEPILSDTNTVMLSIGSTLHSRNTTSTLEAVITADLENANYKWVDCTNGFEPIQGETNQTFILPPSGGSFAVEATTANGCFDRSECFTYGPVGTKRLADLGIRIYPNPVSDILNIENNEAHSIETVEIFDASGMLVKKFIIDTTEPVKLDLQRLNIGLYFLKINVAGDNYGWKLLK